MTTDSVTDVAANLAAVQQRIADAARRAGRSAGAITLVAVSKTQPAAAVQAAYDAGQRVFGENRIEELEEKAPLLPRAIAWHMVGHVQSRKARRVVQAGCALVHSVDSLRLAQRLGASADDAGQPVTILLEVNVSGEATKEGFAPDAVASVLAEMLHLPRLHVVGLMTMAPIVARPEDARPVFRQLREMRDRLARQMPQAELSQLSMGMTDDFEAAIAEGSTLVRVGRAIFGERRG